MSDCKLRISYEGSYADAVRVIARKYAREPATIAGAKLVRRRFILLRSQNSYAVYIADKELSIRNTFRYIWEGLIP
jgi:hypothetical protein